MGNLTEAEKQQIIRMLDDLDRVHLRAVLAGEESFKKWLRQRAYWLYEKISGIMNRIFNWFVDVFLT